LTGVDVTAVVVTWNSRDLLRRCLTALREHAPDGRSLEVVVVDNGSQDGTVELVRREWPEIRLITNDENLGYTRANNQGIAVARGRYLLLVNADAFVAPGACDRLLAAIESDPGIAVAGPRLVFGNGSWQRWTAGRMPSLRAAANHYLFLERLSPTRFEGLYLGEDTTVARDVDWVSSACLLTRAEAVGAIGGMDERLFTYMDDVDLCQRLRDRGWRIRYEPSATVMHLMGGGTGGIASAAALRSFNAYFARGRGPAARVALRALQVLGFALRAAAFAGASLVRREPALRARAGAHWRSLRLSLGGVR